MGLGTTPSPILRTMTIHLLTRVSLHDGASRTNSPQLIGAFATRRVAEKYRNLDIIRRTSTIGWTTPNDYTIEPVGIVAD